MPNEQQRRLNLRPIGPDQVIEELSKRVVLDQHIPLIKNTICVKRVPVDTDPRINVISVEILCGTGSWCETFGSVEQLRYFLKGLKVATVMAGGTYLPQEVVWKFTEDSEVEDLDQDLSRLESLF